MRIHTVGELIQELQQLPEEMPIMAQFQPSWPLREYIGGIWVDDGKDEEEESCDQCLRLALGEPQYLEAEGEAHDAGWFSKCYNCGSMTEVQEPQPKKDEVAYIVLSGSPYDESPYGNKRAWSVI